jgi:hypothetical protein
MLQGKYRQQGYNLFCQKRLLREVDLPWPEWQNAFKFMKRYRKYVDAKCSRFSKTCPAILKD